jgi:hypothetical protein
VKVEGELMTRYLVSRYAQSERFVITDRDHQVVATQSRRETPATLFIWTIVLCLLIALLAVFDWR